MTAASESRADTVPADTVPADTVPADTVPAGTVRASGRQDRAAAWLFGASEALLVALSGRSLAEAQRAYRYAMRLLTEAAAPTDWTSAGLLAASPVREQPPAQDPAAPRLPVSHPGILQLAVTAMRLQSASLSEAERCVRWERLYAFFGARVSARDPQLVRLRERMLNAKVDASDVSPAVVGALEAALAHHAESDGEDAYLTGLARANLAVAFRLRATGDDVPAAIYLTQTEALARSARYGASHPVTLVARALHTRTLLQQAEATDSGAERRELASRALEQASDIRISRDRLFGITAPTSIRARKYEARALLLLGDLDRARRCLEYALAFETAHNDNAEWRGSGSTYLLLAQVHRASGDAQAAARYAERACSLLARYSPAGPSYRLATELREQLRQELTRGE